jgi:hypothetical protein
MGTHYPSGLLTHLALDMPLNASIIATYEGAPTTRERYVLQRNTWTHGAIAIAGSSHEFSDRSDISR